MLSTHWWDLLTYINGLKLLCRMSMTGNSIYLGYSYEPSCFTLFRQNPITGVRPADAYFGAPPDRPSTIALSTKYGF